jgi:hypothetical protein
MRSCLLFCIALFAAGCGSVGQKPEIVVVHRCKDVNFNDLSGHFARLEGKNNISTKYRFEAIKGGAALELRYVPGDHKPIVLRSDSAGPDRVTFTQVGGRGITVEGTINQECRVELDAGPAKDATAASGPHGTHTFAPFESASRLDYEPCTERLYTDGAARSESASKKAKPVTDVLPVTRRSQTTVAAWGPRSELAAGCKPVVHIWSNGEAEVMTDLEESGKGSTVHWKYTLSNDFVGSRAISLRRYAECDGAKKLLGVACAQYEVK